MSSEYKPIAQIAQELPGRPSQMAVWRWCRKGVLDRTGERVRLDHMRCGGRLMVRHQDCDRFFKRLSDGDLEHFQPKERATKAAQEAHDQLDAAGL